jgi:sugar phosphate isomerase/epimerase
MRLGFLTGSVDDIEKAARFGFDGIELQHGAFGRVAEGEADDGAIERAQQLCRKHGVEITAIAYYGVAGSKAAPDEVLKRYSNVFDLVESLGVTTIASMSGFDADRDWDGNLQLFADRFGPVAEEAERRGLRIAFENWMGFGGRPPFRPVNGGGSPDTWDSWFRLVPSKALGLEFDPSHLYWQGIDHMRALHEFKDRVYHVHAKDTEMLPEMRYRYGASTNTFRFRIPGYGEINWAQFITALVEIGYDGGVAIEHEDPIFWNEKFDEGLVRGQHVLHPLVHPGR